MPNVEKIGDILTFSSEIIGEQPFLTEFLSQLKHQYVKPDT